MRLHQLQIKNFISIKQASVDFDDLNDGVFLISGPTGSGKSSMLDALHWVLFGKTLSSNRATVSKEIRSTFAPASEDTVVTLTFNQDKVEYKVIRTLKKDGGTAVQLFVPGAIYDKVKEANEQLEKIIGLNVKQFDQMVMLEQGNFSKFLLADSKTRAEILRDIFDTQLFKDIELRFKDRCSTLKNTILNSTELEQNLLQGEMLETVESAITLTNETIATEQGRLVELKKSNAEAQDMLPKLVAYDQEYAVYKKAQDELNRLEALKPEVEDLYKKRDVFNEYSGVLDWYANYQVVKQEIDKANADEEDYKRRIAAVVVDEELADKISALQQKQTELTQTVDGFNRMTDYESKVEEYQRDLTNLDSNLKTFTEAIDKWEAKRTDLTKRTDTRQKYETAKNEVLRRATDRSRIKADIDELQRYVQSNQEVYKNFLTNQILKVSEKGICPICGNPFTEEHTFEADSAAIDEFEEKQRQLDVLRSNLADMPELPEPPCKEASTLPELAKQLNDCERKLQEARDNQATATAQRATIDGMLTSAKEELGKIKWSIGSKKRADVEAELEEVTKEYRELWAKQDDNEMAKRTRNLLEGYLTGVVDKISQLEVRLADLQAHPDAVKEEDAKLREALDNKDIVEDYGRNINDYLYKIQQYEMLHNNLMSVTEPINPFPGYTADKCKQIISDTNISINESIRVIAEYQGSLEARKDLVKRVRELREVREKDTRSYDAHSYLYNLLSGKNSSKISFETFVLHRQLEWILQSSNQYLYNLSAGQFELQVKWEGATNRTQGGLEINITDHFSGSTRPAQTFSGGELFMLSLSLSLGLMTAIDSMFTTKDLNLLFIDEGFGTLDSDCLSRTLVTLRDLKNIKSVGIISHVQDLIDTIPQGYIVDKTATGSRIKMFKNL